MKAILLFLISFNMVLPVLASEMTVSLEEKVKSSKHVVIGKVISVTKADKYPNTAFGDWVKEGVIIELKVFEVFKGHKKYKNVKIHTGIVSATAGFTGWGVEKDKEFIAYLKEKEQFLTLAGFSGQYLEPIDRSKNQANDLGQTLTKVKLDQKILDIEKITGEEKWHNKSQQTNR